MDADKLYQRYQELQRYVGWTAEDAQHVQASAGLLEPHLPPLVDDFYEEIERHPDARKVITGGEAQIQRLKGTLTQWLRELLSGPYDKLDREVWNLGYVWRQAWEHLALQRQGRDANLHEETGGLDLKCAVDQFRLEQVFRNILENSLAACSDPVRIDVFCAEAEIDDQPAVRVTVRDNGPGLGPEQQDKIFEPFFTTKTKGTGLGMAIAKRIVEAHGGQIAASAAVNGGAEIHMVIPREP